MALVLVGRDDALSQLGGLLDRLGDGGGATVVRGEPGIGKSALLAEVVRRARARRLRVLGTTGVPSEAQVGFAGLHQLLRPVMGHAERLPPPLRDAVLAAFGRSAGAQPELFLLALATLGLLSEAAAQAPVLLVVEDAHWLDRATADVLLFVARRLDREPVVLLAAVQDGFEGPFTGSGLPELVLPRLGRAAAELVVDAHTPGLRAEVRERVLREAAGNPLALVELPAVLAAGAASPSAPLPLSARLEQAFAARVGGLPAATRTVLLVAALNDADTLSETLAAAGLVTGSPCRVDDVEPAVAARLVEVEAGRLRFLHPLMRSAIRQRFSIGRRHRAHAALARVVAEDDRRVWHRAAASDGPDDAVAAELAAVAVRAQRRGGIAAGTAALRRSAELTADPVRRGERLLHAAELAFELGRSDEVQHLLAEADRAGLAERQRWRTAWIRDSFDDGVLGRGRAAVSLAQAAERAAADDPDLALNLLYGAALRCWWTEPGDEARGRIVAAAAGVPVAGDDPRLLMVLAFAAPVEQGGVVLDRLRRHAGHTDGRSARMLGNAAHAVGAFDLAAGFFADSLTGLRAQGRLALLARALTLQARSCAHLADLSVAMPAADEAYRLARDTSQPLIAATALTAQAVVAALRGAHDDAYRLAARAEQAALPVAANAVLAAVQVARGTAALAAGRHAEALAELQRMHDPADPAYHRAIRCHAVSDLADAAVRSGRPDAVRDVLAELAVPARQTPSPALHSGLRYARALLADDGTAPARFEEALRCGPQAGPFARARTQLGYGEWLRRHRRVADSRAHLRAARDTFDALDLIPWGDRARAELRAAGETSRQRLPDARDRLTPQELQIAQMAAGGLTNREIGQRLYLSHRTISSHLHRIFPKLGVTSRMELRTALAPSA
ncbi:AAA family ATPase [Actinoplanes sp. N902-109]|uniref:ATP-binding protein n=1 Tax=Actinoplanes sp. (strain N902-109) TaxID=649831 RepID=UPI0003295572|nr:AAA family ATPase [Actinoplanes sp. N902-109]AGL16807.1 LuxR family transcriptional regulator [Actinoplanes sp. N902-109]